MGNMSYCRFQNTASDLQDCLDAINEENLNELSEAEKRAFVDLVEMATEIADKFRDMDGMEMRDKLKNNEL